MDSIDNQHYNYNVSWWEDIQAPSQDEQYILSYLSYYDLSGFDILHVGVGNSFVARTFPTSRITGLTISILEYQKALSLRFPAYLPVLIDKHDPALNSILNKYDIIIDNNIGSYSPSFESACSFLKIALDHLRPDGYFVTQQEGLSYNNPFDLHEGLRAIESTREILYESNGIVIIK
jgi:hypothetical protein